MKRGLLAAAVLVAALVAAWTWRAGREVAAELPPEPRSGAGAVAPRPLVPAAVLDEPEAAPDERAEVVVAAEAAAPAAEPTAPEPAAEEAEPIDRGRLEPFTVHVRDRFGAPIHDAKVSATGMRTSTNRGDFYGWPGEAPVARTDTHGDAELEYRVWLGAQGGDWLDVADLCFRVEHPDYVTTDEEAEVAEGEATVVLRQGSFLIVSGWIDSPAERLTDVVPHLSHDVGAGARDWLPVADGRPSCSKIPPGEHALYLTLQRDGVAYASEVVPFELVEGDQEELHLQLFPPRSLAGELDPEVPRPVLDGEVMLNLYAEHAGGEAVILREYSAPVAEDGSFRFDGLPPGPGEMIGLCEGWVSRRVRPPDLGPDVELSDWGYWPQQVPAEVDRFVLAMEPTAAVEATVLDPDGAPLPDAEVLMWPNVTWSVGWSDFFLGRTSWRATTDAAGVARIENLPPRASEGLVVMHAGLRLPLDEDSERRTTSVALVPGETTRVTIRMEAGEPD